MAVKRAVYSWSIRFKSAGYGNDQLSRLSTEYLEDLQSEGVTLRQFEAAALSVRKRCRFFPSMADILDAVKEYRANPPVATSGALQIADVTSRHDLTPEELERNQKRVQMIAEALAGRMSFEEAEREVKRMEHIKEFTIHSEQETGVRW
jgi:hypothetical protein